MRAADSGLSMEKEVRLILRAAVALKPSARNLASIIRSHFGPGTVVLVDKNRRFRCRRVNISSVLVPHWPDWRLPSNDKDANCSTGGSSMFCYPL